jgi:hypothetical protein
MADSTNGIAASVEDIAPEWLTFHTAAEWGAEWKRPPVAERLNDAETYIHHGGGSRIATDHIKAMRGLQAWYHDVKNYSAIAYDVMVHLNVDDGTVAILGARENWLTAATKDRNDTGEAICLFGNFHPGSSLSELPSEREIEALAFAVAWSIEQGWSAPDTKVMGHRDNPAHPGATSCPGDSLYPHVAGIGERAQELLRIANTSAEQSAPSTDLEEDDMSKQYLWRHKDADKPGLFWFSNGGVCHVDGGLRDRLLADGVEIIDSTNDDAYRSIMLSIGRGAEPFAA